MINTVAGSFRSPLLNCSATALFPSYSGINTFSGAELNRYTTRKRKIKYAIQQNFKSKCQLTCALSGNAHVRLCYTGPICEGNVVQCTKYFCLSL